VAFKVLLTENISPLGAALLRGFEAHSLPVVTPENAEDLPLQMELHRPAVIINPQSISVAAGARDLVAQAHALFELSRLNSSALIHFSTHQVFGATQYGAALSEVDPPLPDDAYGRELLRQEEVLALWERSLIVRLPWVLDFPGGILESMCQAMLYGEECVVSDVWRGSPIFIEDAVRLTLAMIQQIQCGASNWGRFHLHSSDSCSEAELADHIARLLQKQGYEPGTIALAAIEQRFIASNGWLKGQRCTNNFGFQYRSWRQGIKVRVMEWLEEEIKIGRLAPPISA
jgi:dTDP-4-dehydrorhamnose reductase